MDGCLSVPYLSGLIVPVQTVGTTQVALKLPFAFHLQAGWNAYDISRDLATVIYARPGGHADLYLLSQR